MKRFFTKLCLYLFLILLISGLLTTVIYNLHLSTFTINITLIQALSWVGFIILFGVLATVLPPEKSKQFFNHADIRRMRDQTNKKSRL